MRAFLLIAALPALAAAQPETPVTKREMARVFARVEASIRPILATEARPAPTETSAAPASRLDAIRTMHRIFTGAKPRFTLTPRPLPLRPGVTTLPANAPVRHQAEELVRWGFLAPGGPLLTSKTPAMAPRDLGDAVGYFLARLADLTHLPKPKWSPYLQDDMGEVPPPRRR